MGTLLHRIIQILDWYGRGQVVVDIWNAITWKQAVGAVTAGAVAAVSGAHEEWSPTLIGLAVLVAFVGVLILWNLLEARFAGARPIKRMPMLELRNLAAKRGWDFVSGTSLHVLDLVDAIRQAGVDARLMFYGRPDRNMFRSLTEAEPLDAITREHWKEFQIEAMSFMRAEKNFDIKTYSMRQSHEKGFADVHVDRAAIRWLRTEAEAWKGRRKP